MNAMHMLMHMHMHMRALALSSCAERSASMRCWMLVLAGEPLGSMGAVGIHTRRPRPTQGDAAELPLQEIHQHRRVHLL